MCACEPGFVCLRCVSTPFDDSYLEDEQVSEEAFEEMTHWRVSEPLMFGGGK